MAHEVTFEAGGASYALRFGMAAMARFERATGKNALVAAQSLDTGLADPEAQPVQTIAALFGASLRPQLSDEDAVLDLMDEVGFAAAMGYLGQAIEGAMDGLEEQAGNPPSASKKTRSGRG